MHYEASISIMVGQILTKTKDPRENPVEFIIEASRPGFCTQQKISEYG
jgi:hypothetical protein